MHKYTKQERVNMCWITLRLWITRHHVRKHCPIIGKRKE